MNKFKEPKLTPKQQQEWAAAAAAVAQLKPSRQKGQTLKEWRTYQIQARLSRETHLAVMRWCIWQERGFDILKHWSEIDIARV